MLLVEVKLREKNWGPKLGFSPFSQVCIISFPWYCTGFQLETIFGPNQGKNEVFQNFLSYFSKRGKVLLNWYFISVDYIEFLSHIIQSIILPSLGIEQLNDFESNLKRGPCYSRNFEIFSILMPPDVQSNLLVFPWILRNSPLKPFP